MKNIIGTLLLIGLLAGCNNAPSPNAGKVYEDLWYLTTSNPGAGVLVMEVNATASRQCGKHFDLKKLIVWDRFNEALQKGESKDVDGRSKAINQMVSDICAET